MPMMAITTSSSMRVKARNRPEGLGRRTNKRLEGFDFILPMLD